MKITLAILTGPTASGKSALAIDLAKEFPFEIVNADALQVFRHLNIGTAKPKEEILRAVPHHLVDLLDPDAEASAAWYAEEAGHVISKIVERGKIPLVVGGSGFYLRALEKPPLSYPSTGEFQTENLAEAFENLRLKDPVAALKIHPNDRYRIERAMEQIERGVLPSQQWEETAGQPSPYETVWIGLAWEREALYDRINQRVIEMFERGLVKETESVLAQFPRAEKRLLRAIGYRESFRLLRGETSAEEALKEAQQRTRQYAKRQITWFQREAKIHWLAPKNALSESFKLMNEAFLP